MEHLEFTLKQLVSVYGYSTVHTKLDEMMKKDYEDLRRIFEKQPVERQSETKAKPKIEQKQEKEPVDEERNLMSMRDKKIKILKKDTILEVPVPQASVPQASVPQASVPESLSTAAAKEAKQHQKELEAKKRLELEASGIVPESLLTEENLRRWILTEKRTFAYIARTYVGCPEAQVATVAKSFQIESEISKKRAEIIRGKKGRV
jgi:hypothetical protein